MAMKKLERGMSLNEAVAIYMTQRYALRSDISGH